MLDVLQANATAVLYSAIMFAVLYPAITTYIPQLRFLKSIRLPIPFLGTILVEGIIIMSATLFYLWSVGGFAEVNLTVAKGIGIGLILVLLQKNINAFPGPG